MPRSPRDYEKLKQLLEAQEKFPTQYVHKFIGRNSPGFQASIAVWEKRFPKAIRQSSRTSSGDAHLAVTYVFLANCAEEIIFLLKETETIEDILVIL